MNIVYKYCEGTQTTRPSEIDTDSSKRLVYLRRDIHQITREEDGETVTLWAYEEARLSREEYIKYITENLVPGLLRDTELNSEALCDVDEAYNQRMADLEEALCELSELLNS